jgi:hypothetical protein
MSTNTQVVAAKEMTAATPPELGRPKARRKMKHRQVLTMVITLFFHQYLS